MTTHPAPAAPTTAAARDAALRRVGALTYAVAVLSLASTGALTGYMSRPVDLASTDAAKASASPPAAAPIPHPKRTVFVTVPAAPAVTHAKPSGSATQRTSRTAAPTVARVAAAPVRAKAPVRRPAVAPKAAPQRAPQQQAPRPAPQQPQPKPTPSTGS